MREQHFAGVPVQRRRASYAHRLVVTLIAGVLLGALGTAWAAVVASRDEVRRSTRAETFAVKLPALRDALRDPDYPAPIREALTGLYYSAAVTHRYDRQRVHAMLMRLIPLESAKDEWDQASDRLRDDSVEWRDEQQKWEHEQSKARRDLRHMADEYNGWLEDRFAGKPRSYMPRSVWRRRWKREQERLAQQA